MYGFFDDAVKPLAIFFAIVGAAIFGIMFVCNEFGRYQCESYQRIAGVETRYNNWDICYVKTPVGWQRWDEYVKRAVASEGLKELKK